MAKFAEKGTKNGYLNTSIAFRGIGNLSHTLPQTPTFPVEHHLSHNPIPTQPDIFNIDLTCKNTSASYPAIPGNPYTSAPHPDAVNSARPPCCLNFGPNDPVQSTDNKITVVIGVAARVHQFYPSTAATNRNPTTNLAGVSRTEMSFTHISTSDTRIPGQPVYMSLDEANITDTSPENWLRSPELIETQQKSTTEAIDANKIDDKWSDRWLRCLNQEDTKVNKTWQKTKGEACRVEGSENKQYALDRIAMQNSIMNTEITMIKGKKKKRE